MKVLQTNLRAHSKLIYRIQLHRGVEGSSTHYKDNVFLHFKSFLLLEFWTPVKSFKQYKPDLWLCWAEIIQASVTPVYFMLTYLGEAVCSEAVSTASGTAFKSARLVHTDPALTSAGGAVTRAHLSGMQLQRSVVSQLASVCLQAFQQEVNLERSIFSFHLKSKQ